MLCHRKRTAVILMLALLVTAALLPVARAEDAITAKATIAIYDRNTEQRVRSTGETSYSMDGLKSGEYLSFEIETHHSRRMEIRNIYARINGGERMGWSGTTAEAGSSFVWHIYYVHMGQLKPGVYRLDFYINDTLLLTQYLTLRSEKNWSRVMSLPTASEIAAFRSDETSPYIVCLPQFPGVTGYTEYAVDFKADHQPRGTYLCCADFYMNIRYGGHEGTMHAYCGFQVIYDGTHVAICSVWDTECTDARGKFVIPRANVVSAKNVYRNSGFDGEGTGAHCSVRYNWKQGHAYRLILQLLRSNETGTDHLYMWVTDLENMVWTKLIEYDLKVTDAYIFDNGAFLENYMSDYAGEIRSMELSNARVYSTDGKWVSAREAIFLQNYDHPGSYTYGSSGNAFYTITTGLPGRCARPQDWQHVYVTQCETESPYELLRRLFQQ